MWSILQYEFVVENHTMNTTSNGSNLRKIHDNTFSCIYDQAFFCTSLLFMCWVHNYFHLLSLQYNSCRQQMWYLCIWESTREVNLVRHLSKVIELMKVDWLFQPDDVCQISNSCTNVMLSPNPQSFHICKEGSEDWPDRRLYSGQ